MRKIIKNRFEIGWIPLALALFVSFIFVSSHFITSFHYKNASFYLLIFVWAGFLISTIHQFYKRKWVKGIVTGIFTIIVLFGFLYYAVAQFLIDQSKPDRFADDLIIPDNILIENPIDFSDTNSTRLYNDLKNQKSQIDFFLYYSFQPGIYKYDLWVSSIEKGNVYLKAFEVTKNYQLSEIRLKEKTTISIFNPTDSLMKYGIKEDFIIYEGDFGKPYAARFEIWFNPDNEGKERKLIEKNYKIEGWMR